MEVVAPPDVPAAQVEDARLEALGYKPQLNRVLGLFANFSVAFTYLSPMVGIYTLFVLGVGTGGPAYVWLTFIPVIGMLFVALVFGELASHYPVAGALYQYSKFSVSRCVRVVRRLVLRARPPDHGRSRRHGGRHVRHRAHPQLVRLELQPGASHDDPPDHADPPRDPDRPQHHRRQGDGSRRAVRRVRRDRRHPRHRPHPPDPRLPPRARVPLHDPGSGERGDQPARASTSAATGSPAPP